MDRGSAEVLLVIACLLGGVVVAQPLLPIQSQGFSSLGVLGSTQTISNYPMSVAVNQTISLYAQIGNYESNVIFYEVLVKLVVNSSLIISNTTYTSAPVIARYSQVVMQGQNATLPVSLSISTPGNNLRILFELWSYDPGISNFTYSGLDNYLWLNVTGI